MTPHEIAMKFASASATCGNGRCPFSSECRGTTETCKMKEVAMVIRDLVAENATLKAQCNAVNELSKTALVYMGSLEKIVDYYHRTCVSFQNGYRPKKKIAKKSARTTKKRKPKDPSEMDGDERYAYTPEKPEKPETVII